MIDGKVRRKSLSDYQHLSGFVVDHGVDRVLRFIKHTGRQQILILGSRAKYKPERNDKNIFGMMRNNLVGFKRRLN